LYSHSILFAFFLYEYLNITLDEMLVHHK
jgi:hypothetical protein